MSNDLFKPKPMTALQRRAFVNRADGDSLTCRIAELLSKQQTAEAAGLVPSVLAVMDADDFRLWLTHYAIAQRNVSRYLVRNFLDSILPEATAVGQVCL